MLDECKGERFGELLAHFAMLVLRKVIERRKDLPLVTRTILDSSQDQQQVVPLSIAYKTSLRVHLESRRQLVAQLSDQKQSLDDRDAELTERRHAVLEALSKHSQEDYSTSLDILKSSWSGDSGWLAVLLSEVPASSERALTLDILLSNDGGADNSCLLGQSSALMNGLDERIQKHESKLKEWKIYQSSHLNEDQPKKIPEKNLASSSHRTWSMDKHQYLRLLPTRMEGHSMTPDERPDLPPGHADLLERMERELRTSGGSLPRLENASVRPLHAQPASQPQPDADLGIKGPATSKTVEPVLRTPKKRYERLFTSSATSTPTNSSPRKQHADISECSWLAESTRGMTASPDLPPMSNESDTSTSCKKDQYENAVSVVDKSQLSLEDRTRMSMASTHVTSPDRAAFCGLNKVPAESKHVWSSSPLNSTAQLSLADRTWHSMSLLDRVSDAKSKSRHAQTDRLHNVDPVNQFENPHKQSRQQTALTPMSNNTTPREDLFIDQADEASIFKSRVKIAISPLVSPERGVLDGSFMEVSRLEDTEDCSV